MNMGLLSAGPVFSLLVIYPEVKLLDHMGILFLLFEELPYCFPQ